jgi:hypothetical protein
MKEKAAGIATIVALVCVGGGTIARAQTDSGVQQPTASALPEIEFNTGIKFFRLAKEIADVQLNLRRLHCPSR